MKWLAIKDTRVVAWRATFGVQNLVIIVLGRKREEMTTHYEICLVHACILMGLWDDHPTNAKQLEKD